MVSARPAAKWRRRSQAGTGCSARAARARSSGPRRTSPAWPTTHSQAALTPRGSAGDAVPSPRGAGELVLDQLEVGPGQLVQVALEGQGPVLGRPLADVVQAVRQLLRQH